MAGAEHSPSPPTERVLAIVGLLVAQPDREVTLTELASELGLSISTCHAITSVLVGRGYLLRSPTEKTFTLGPSLLTAGRAAELALPAARIARSRVASLGVDLGVEAVASIVADRAITVVEWSPPPSGEAAAHLGQRIPFTPPFGAVHAAWGGQGLVDDWLSRAPRGTHDELRSLLATIRERGYDVHRNDARAARFREAIGELEHDALSPAARTALDLLLGELATVTQLPARFDGRRSYAINTVSTAVRDRAGAPVLTLSLLFHRRLTGTQIEAAGAALIAAATT